MSILFWLAVLPSILLAARVLSYDRIEKEPPRLLIKLFVMGMLTCIPAALIEAAGEWGITAVGFGPFMTSALTYLLLVPLAEEGMKLLALRSTHRDPNFNYTFDGIVYSVMVALGFATLENILYVFEFQTVETAVMRGIISVPMHCVCGIFMGYFYGVSRGQEARGSAQAAATADRLTLAVPSIIHGVFDFSLDQESELVTLLGLAFTVLVFFVAIRNIKMASETDQPIMPGFATPAAPPAAPPAEPAARPAVKPVEPLSGKSGSVTDDGKYATVQRKSTNFWVGGGTPPPPFNMQ